MLRKHLEHPAIRHFPTGIGGRGEVEFIRQARAEKHFLLHHGITTFLRIGDISFVDLRRRTVSGLGELKSHGTQPGHVYVTLHAISKDCNDLPRIFAVPGVFQQGSRHDRPPASPEFKKRLNRQVSGMSSALSREEPDLKSSLFNAYHTEELSPHISFLKLA